MSDNSNKDDDDVMNQGLSDIPENVEVIEDTNITEDIVDEPEVSEESTSEEIDEDVVVGEVSVDSFEDERDGIHYDQTKVDLRGESPELLKRLLQQVNNTVGGSMLDARVTEVGSWENIIFRGIQESSSEEQRIQEFLGELSEEERNALASTYRDPETNKILLRTAAITNKGGVAGVKKQLSGDAAILAFENLKNSGSGAYRVPLYNSGISVDIVTPTGNDIQTMITNCLLMDKEMGSSQGAHYFAYYDLLYKTQILKFIRPLIVNSSYIDWRKPGKLWSIIKLPDLSALVTTIAALCYKDGFDGFVTRCTREISKDHPELCGHVETFKANIFDMIVTRFSIMNQHSIEFMTNSRAHGVRHTLAQIAKYQSELGFEGEKITFGDVTFVMRIPTIAEYQDAGNEFISDIMNEIQGDNTDGHYTQFGFRYMRVFLPWVASMEAEGPNGEILTTSDQRAILRQFEKLDRDDDENVLRDKLRGFINRSQLTYVGYPALPCPSCGHVADTPSGMLTMDPFSVFFTQALLYSKPSE